MNDQAGAGGAVPVTCTYCGKPFHWWQLIIGRDSLAGLAHRGCAIDAGTHPPATIGGTA